MFAPLNDPNKILKREEIPVPTWQEWLEKQQMPQRQQQETGSLAALQVPETDEPVQQTPPRALSPLEVQTNVYNREVQSKPHKQGALAQAAWWAVQGLNKIFNPQDDTPIQYLGEAKRQQRIMKEGQKLAPLQAQEQFSQQSAKVGMDVKKTQSEILAQQQKMKIDAFNNDPIVKMVFDAKEVSPEQSAYLKSKYGVDYATKYWGDWVEEEVEGKRYIRPKSKPNYQVNTSIGVDRPKTVASVPLSGGGVGYTDSKSAVSNDKDERVAGVNKAVQLAVKNADLLSDTNRRNVDRANEYKGKMTAYTNKMAEIYAGAGDQAGVNEIAQWTKIINDANDRYIKATVDGEIDADGVTAYHKKVDEANIELAKLYDKQKAAFKQAGLKPPPKPKFEKAVQVEMGTKPKKDSLKLF